MELCSACPAAAVAAPAPAPVAVAPPKVDVDAHGAWPPGVIGETGDIIVVGCVIVRRTMEQLGQGSHLNLQK